MQHNLRNILNPNLDESVFPDRIKENGLIDDLEELDYDYDLQDDDFYEHRDYSEDEQESEKEEDMWEDEGEETIEEDQQ